ncbi:MAG: hypothetical protein M0P31_18620 [Solirubrobacteraceae bacterium]|nr:hypothetical protein [Solirubrobacteraceae bacterium]
MLFELGNALGTRFASDMIETSPTTHYLYPERAAPERRLGGSEDGISCAAPRGRTSGFGFARQGLVRDDRAARCRLRRQIARLERPLTAAVSDDLVAGARGRVGSTALAPQARIGGRPLDHGELERCRDDLVGLVRQVDDQRTTERVDRELLPEMYRGPRRIGIDTSRPGISRSAAEGYTRSSPVRHGRILDGWWRVKVSSGCPSSA